MRASPREKENNVSLMGGVALCGHRALYDVKQHSNNTRLCQTGTVCGAVNKETRDAADGGTSSMIAFLLSPLLLAPCFRSHGLFQFTGPSSFPALPPH